MKKSISALLASLVLFGITPAAAGSMYLSGVNAQGNNVIVEVPTADDDSSSQSTDSMVPSSIVVAVLEEKVGIITMFKPQSCDFRHGASLACELSGETALAGATYRAAPGRDTYVCEAGCDGAAPKALEAGTSQMPVLMP